VRNSLYCRAIVAHDNFVLDLALGNKSVQNCLLGTLKSLHVLSHKLRKIYNT